MHRVYFDLKKLNLTGIIVSGIKEFCLSLKRSIGFCRAAGWDGASVMVAVLFVFLVPFVRDAAAAGVRYLGRVPPHFQPAPDSDPAAARFVSRGVDYSLQLAPGAAELNLERQPPGGPAQSALVKLRCVGTSAFASISGEDELPYKVQVQEGDRRETARETSGFMKVRMPNVFPGIDWVYAASEKYLDYYFVLAAQADIRDIVIEFDGAEKLALGMRGELIVQTPAGRLIQPPPRLYQEIAGHRVEIPGGYILLPNNRVGFTAGEYDQLARLVIDPVLIYFLAQPPAPGISSDGFVAPSYRVRWAE